jgi:hypothetical protein
MSKKRSPAATKTAKRGARKTRSPVLAVPSSDFWRSKSVEQLAREQGVQPVDNPDDLLGDFWPEDESIDDFLAWLQEVRRDNGVTNASRGR